MHLDNFFNHGVTPKLEGLTTIKLANCWVDLFLQCSFFPVPGSTSSAWSGGMPQVRIHVTEKLADFASYIFVRHGLIARFDCYPGALLSDYGDKDVNTAKKKTYVYI